MSLPGVLEIRYVSEFDYLMFVCSSQGDRTAAGPVGEHNIVLIDIPGDYLSVVSAGTGDEAGNCHSDPAFDGVVDQLLHKSIILLSRGFGATVDLGGVPRTLSFTKRRTRSNANGCYFARITDGGRSPAWRGFLLQDPASLTYYCTNVGMFDRPPATGNP